MFVKNGYGLFYCLGPCTRFLPYLLLSIFSHLCQMMRDFHLRNKYHLSCTIAITVESFQRSLLMVISIPFVMIFYGVCMSGRASNRLLLANHAPELLECKRVMYKAIIFYANTLPSGLIFRIHWPLYHTTIFNVFF